MNQSPPVNAPKIAVVAFGLIFSCTIPVSAQEMVTLTDTTGVSVKLATFFVQLRAHEGGLSLPFASSSPFTQSYSTPPAIPIRLANGVFEFVAIDKINEYQSDGTTATITLVDGGQVKGWPLMECRFSGEATLGMMFISAHNVRTLKFSPQKAKEFLDAHSSRLTDLHSTLKRTWPDNDKVIASITLVSGDEIRLQSPVLVYEFHDSNGQTYWSVEGEVFVNYGMMEVRIGLAKMHSIELPYPAGAAASPFPLSITLRGGEKIAATLILGKGSKVLALLGTTENGFAHVPFDRVKSITFLNGE